jgi:hypothetical protein
LVLHVLSSFQGNKKISMEPFDEQWSFLVY